MNAKQVILDFMRWGGWTDQEVLIDEYLALKEPKQEEEDWFMLTQWTENRA